MNDTLSGTASHTISVSAWSDCATCHPGDHVDISIGAKCLEGCSIWGRTAVVLNADGHAVGRATLGEPETPGGLCPAAVRIQAPPQPKLHELAVVIEPDEIHGPARKSLYITVLPEPDRPCTFRIVDSRTGDPLPQASLYLFNRSIGKGRPQTVDPDAGGVVQVNLCSTSEYAIRAECENYNEGGCDLREGEDPVEMTIELLSLDYNKEVVNRPGFDPY